MKSFVVLAALVAVALAVPVEYEKDAAILRNDFDNLGIDNFNYNVETSNGINLAAVGEQESVPLPDGGYTEGLVVRGEYSYLAPDGLIYKVSYIADKNGYRATGDHIPV